MSIVEFFRLIKAPPARPAAEESEITAAEVRLGGRLPEGLRAWYRQADGFDGEAKIHMWRFAPLGDLYALLEIFPYMSEFRVVRDGHPDRPIVGSDYVIFCHAMIYLPYYAVNIRPDSPHFSEVVYGMESRKVLQMEEHFIVGQRFETFANNLFAHPDDFLLPEE